MVLEFNTTSKFGYIMEQLEFEKDIKIDDKDALIIVDIQNDFYQKAHYRLRNEI